jgi:hypothetical protein
MVRLRKYESNVYLVQINGMERRYVFKSKVDLAERIY